MPMSTQQLFAPQNSGWVVDLVAYKFKSKVFLSLSLSLYTLWAGRNVQILWLVVYSKNRDMGRKARTEGNDPISWESGRIRPRNLREEFLAEESRISSFVCKISCQPELLLPPSVWRDVRSCVCAETADLSISFLSLQWMKSLFFQAAKEESWNLI